MGKHAKVYLVLAVASGMFGALQLDRAERDDCRPSVFDTLTAKIAEDIS